MSFRVVKTGVLHPARMKEVVFHAACAKPDKHSDADYARLLEDVKQNGIRVPIKIQDSSGDVVCGRHRIRAAKEVGVPIPYERLELSDAECWSLSRSELAHRHLSPQRAAALFIEMRDEEEKVTKAEHAANTKAAEPEEEDDVPGDDEQPKKEKKEKKEKKRSKKGEGKKSAKDAKAAGVSPATMERMTKIKKKGIPALWKAAEAEDVTAADAAFICDFDVETQRKCLNMVKNGEAKTLAKAKAALDKAEADAKGPKLLDGKKQEVPGKLRTVFEDRERFSVLRENINDCRKNLNALCGRASGKHLPKDLVKQLDDIALALDIYQPYAVKDESEDGWITKREATK